MGVLNAPKFTEGLERQCPYMMSIGMTYDQYWYGDVRMTGAFLDADRRRQERFNEEAWLLGAYVYDAVGRLAPIFRFGVDKPKAVPYREQPIDLFSDREKRKEEYDREAENERLKAIWFFKRWAKDTSEQFKKK